MPSDEPGDFPASGEVLLTARVPADMPVDRVGQLIELLRSQAGVSFAEVSGGGFPPVHGGWPIATRGAASDPAGGNAREALLATILTRQTLVPVLSCLLQAGCHDFVKKQHLPE